MSGHFETFCIKGLIASRKMIKTPQRCRRLFSHKIRKNMHKSRSEILTTAPLLTIVPYIVRDYSKQFLGPVNGIKLNLWNSIFKIVFFLPWEMNLDFKALICNYVVFFHISIFHGFSCPYFPEVL